MLQTYLVWYSLKNGLYFIIAVHTFCFCWRKPTNTADRIMSYVTWILLLNVVERKLGALSWNRPLKKSVIKAIVVTKTIVGTHCLESDPPSPLFPHPISLAWFIRFLAECQRSKKGSTKINLTYFSCEFVYIHHTSSLVNGKLSLRNRWKEDPTLELPRIWQASTCIEKWSKYLWNLFEMEQAITLGKLLSTLTRNF